MPAVRVRVLVALLFVAFLLGGCLLSAVLLWDGYYQDGSYGATAPVGLSHP
jgi:hypothetical protein